MSSCRCGHSGPRLAMGTRLSSSPHALAACHSHAS
uniref:Uncharacterized protein n=1 Tax=Arundo donax TaxID=35708 RepID=A0A0A9HDS5_ARUDO